MQEGSATKGVKPVAAATATKPVRTAQELCAGIPHEIIVMRAQQPNYIYLCRFYAPPSLAPHGLTSRHYLEMLIWWCPTHWLSKIELSDRGTPFEVSWMYTARDVTKWHDTYIAQLKAADRSLSLSETIDIIYNAWASTPPPRTHRSFQKGGTESHTSLLPEKLWPRILEYLQMDTPSLEVSIRGVSWFFQQVVDKIVAQRMQRRTDAYAAMALVVENPGVRWLNSGRNNDLVAAVAEGAFHVLWPHRGILTTHNLRSQLLPGALMAAALSRQWHMLRLFHPRNTTLSCVALRMVNEQFARILQAGALWADDEDAYQRSKKLPNSSAINALNVEDIVACADAWRCEKYTGCKWQNFDRVYHRFSKQVPCDALSMLCHWPCDRDPRSSPPYVVAALFSPYKSNASFSPKFIAWWKKAIFLPTGQYDQAFLARVARGFIYRGWLYPDELPSGKIAAVVLRNEPLVTPPEIIPAKHGAAPVTAEDWWRALSHATMPAVRGDADALKEAVFE